MDSDKILMTVEAIETVNSELAYQNRMAETDRANDKDNGLAGQIVTMNHYMNKLNEVWTMSNGNKQALNCIRKIVATGLRAMIRYGCYKRLWEPF